MNSLNSSLHSWMNPEDLWRPDTSDFIVDPYPHYEKIRQLAPVFISKRGDHVVLSHQHVRQVLSDSNIKVGMRATWMKKAVAYAVKKKLDYSAIQNVMEGAIFHINPDLHTQLRGMLVKKWPKRAAIQETAKTHANTIAENLPKQGNLVNEVSRLQALRVINDLVGSAFSLDQITDDIVMLTRISDPFLTVKDLGQLNAAALRLYDKFSKFYNESDLSSPGLIGHVKANQELLEQLGVSPVTMAIFLHLAGQDNTAFLISATIEVLINDSAMLEEVENDEEKLKALINEVLRINAPIQITERVNSETLELDGHIIPANSAITVCIGAANRDPKVFEHPDKIDLSRKNNHHISFGYGIHHCMGNHIALLETFELVKALLPKLKGMKIIGKTRWDERLSIRNIVEMKYELHGN